MHFPVIIISIIILIKKNKEKYLKNIFLSINNKFRINYSL